MTAILVTMPTDLAAWYAFEARENRMTTNDLMVRVLDDYRAQVNAGPRRPDPDSLVESPFGGGY